MGLYGDNGKENGNYQDYRGYTRGYIGVIGYILGLYGENGKENGNYQDYRGYTRGYIGVIGYILGLYGDNGKKMETILIMGYVLESFHTDFREKLLRFYWVGPWDI